MHTQPPMTAQETYTFDDVSVVMGTYNEEAAIETVLTDIATVTDDRAEIICVDSSDDRTPAIAEAHGAAVHRQPPAGYGRALLTAIQTADRPVVITTDCDDTYPMDVLPTFLDLINQGYDVVSGNRLAGDTTAMPPFNRLGNTLFAAAASLLLTHRIHDPTTGMRAYRQDVLASIDWTENTGLSAELLMRPIARGYTVCEHPIPYDERLGETTLNPLTGGAAIAKSILKIGLQERFY